MASFNNYKHVFTPIKVGHTTYKNRIEFSPMVCDYTNSIGEPSQMYVDFVESQAKSGVSMIHLGATPVEWETGADYPNELDVTDDRKMSGLKLLSEAAHIHGAKLSVELVHAGRGVHPSLIKKEWGLAPSNFPIPGQYQYIKEMDQRDIEMVIKAYVDCSVRLKACDFDGVLIHAAHGNLLAQFLSPLTNHRSDLYGGTLENRCRFPLMVLRAVREAVGTDFVIEMRISGDEMVEGGMKIDEVIGFIKPAQEFIDSVSISAGRIVDWSAQFYTMPPYFRPRGANVYLSKQVKDDKDITIPVSVVGGITDLELADKIIDEGGADIIFMARGLLADQDMLYKSYRGKPEDVRPCLRCWDCGRLGHVGCAINPSLGRTARYNTVTPALKKKKVVVIGGGAAGMEAAQTLIKRGHDVVLFEKKDILGGNLHDINKFSFKDDMLRYTEWAVRTTMACGAEIRLNTEARPELVLAENPDAIIVAVGGIPAKPPIPGIDGSNVIGVLDVDSGRVSIPTGSKVVVCGGGSSGCESALALAMEGNGVTVVDQIPESRFVSDLSGATRTMLLYLLEENNVKLLGDHIIRSIDNDAVNIENRTWEYRTLQADYVVDALGMKPNPVVNDFFELTPDVYYIGDCDQIGSLRNACHTAYNLCSQL